MNVTGIIAEFNPLHNGHLHLIREAKKITNADYVVVVMSGDFCQRGIPAIVDKHTRTAMALAAGADLVLELPIYYSLGSAEYFAKGAAATLIALGCVDHIVFGSESGSIEAMKAIADILLEEPKEFREALAFSLKQGNSFPKAREDALSSYFLSVEKNNSLQTKNVSLSSVFLQDFDLSSPNNLLGIEYIKALRQFHSAITPVTIRRIPDLDTSSYFHSASGIRDVLLQKKENPDPEGRLYEYHPCGDPVEVSNVKINRLQLPISIMCAVPYETQNQLQVWQDEKGARFPQADDFSAMLHYRLLMERDTGFTEYLDVSEDLSNKICNRINEFESFTQFVSLLKSRDLTETRVQRCLLHILLNIRKKNMEQYLQEDLPTTYLRILGFRKDSTNLLHMLRESASLPLISKLADAEKLLEPTALQLLREDILASEIYDSVAYESATDSPIRGNLTTNCPHASEAATCAGTTLAHKTEYQKEIIIHKTE